MRKFLTSSLLLAVCSASAQSPPSARFSGSGTLQSAIVDSADGRFSLNAELRGTETKATSARFAIDARLEQAGKDKTALTACGPVSADIFKNGFEN